MYTATRPLVFIKGESRGEEAAPGAAASAFFAAVSEWRGSRPGWLATVTTIGIDTTGKTWALVGLQLRVSLLMLRDGQERDQGGNGSYNDRNEGWEDRRGSSGGHQQSLLRPNYLGGSNDSTSFSPGRPALMASPGAMKVMGGAGITENLDRPNMPVGATSLLHI